MVVFTGAEGYETVWHKNEIHLFWKNKKHPYSLFDGDTTYCGSDTSESLNYLAANEAN